MTHFTILYARGTSENIYHVLRKYNNKTTYKSNNFIQNLHISERQKTTFPENSLTMHIRPETIKKYGTSLARHSLENFRHFNLKNVTVLTTENNYQKESILEMLYRIE